MGAFFPGQVRSLFSWRLAVPTTTNELDCLDLKHQSWILNFWPALMLCVSSCCEVQGDETISLFLLMNVWVSFGFQRDGALYWVCQWDKAFPILQSFSNFGDVAKNEAASQGKGNISVYRQYNKLYRLSWIVKYVLEVLLPSLPINLFQNILYPLCNNLTKTDWCCFLVIQQKNTGCLARCVFSDTHQQKQLNYLQCLYSFHVQMAFKSKLMV